MNRLFNLFAILFLATAFHAKAQYITVWKTDNPGTSASNQIIIPAFGTNYSIAWEEVGNPANKGTATGSDSYTLTFPAAGTYQVSITPGSGTFNQISFNTQGDQYKLLKIKQWGTISWASMNYAYFLCSNLTIEATDVPDLQAVEDMSFMFYNCVSLATIPKINDWDVSGVQYMNYTFALATKFNGPIGDWNVANVTNMSAMFYTAANFNQPLADWDTRNVVKMEYMFRYAHNFNQPIGSWEISNVADMTNMLDQSGMDCASMTQTLQGWAANSATPDNITFDASDRTYGSEGAAALTTLRNAKNWNITIGSQVVCSALDVSLIRFDAHEEAGKVKLEWATANETDNDYFEIERSENAINWQVVNHIKGAGTVTSAQNYSVTDPEPLGGTSYYRLKYVDFSGVAGYSTIRAIKMGIPAKHDLYPNPATTSITISGKPEGHLKMYNLSGLEVMQTEIKAEKQQISVGQLPAGTYIIKMDDGWNTKYIKR